MFIRVLFDFSKTNTCSAGVYLLKIKNKNTRKGCKQERDTRTTYFTPLSRVSIVDFEQIKTGQGESRF